MTGGLHLVEQFAQCVARKWREEEEFLRKRGLNTEGRLVRSMADDLVAEAARWLDELLTLREAAEIAGYSYSALEHLVRQGRLENAGEKGRPRVRRRSLPQKPMSGAEGYEATAPNGRPRVVDRDDHLDLESLVDDLL